MNDIFSSLFQKDDDNDNGRGATGDVQMTSSVEVLNLDKFFKDVESIKVELDAIESLYKRLQDTHEQSKTIHNSKSIKQLRSQMDSDVTLTLNKAKAIKVGLESLDRANAENLKIPGCGPGSSSARTRSSVVNGLRKKLKDHMESFNGLRERIGIDYKETVERRYFMVTGEKADEKTVENLIASGESETFMQKVIQEQGRGRVVDTIAEILERHDAVMEIEKSLNELHQVFMDMAVLVQVQGEQLDDIESQVTRASSFVRRGNNKLQRARFLQKNTRKWSACALFLLIIVLLVIILPLVLRK